MSQKKERKARFAFTVERDLFLLKAVLNCNPWLYGDQQWTDVRELFETKNWTVTEKSLKNRLALLRAQYKKDDLPKTGLETQQTERGELIVEVEAMVDSAAATQQPQLIIQIGPNDEGIDLGYGQTGEGEDGAMVNVTVDAEGSPKPVSKRQLLLEKAVADENRDGYLKRLADEPAEPTGTRKKRTRIFEEDLIEKRQLHEMEMEMKKHNLDEMREKRLEEEGRRRDELANAQLQVQKQQLDQQKMFMELFTKVLK